VVHASHNAIDDLHILANGFLNRRLQVCHSCAAKQYHIRTISDKLFTHLAHDTQHFLSRSLFQP
jgi:hypothetical protein